MAEIKSTIKKPSPLTTNSYTNDGGMSNGLRAAAVHGTLIQEDNMVRRPMRLESLPSVGGGKKGKKKKNGLDPL